MIQGGLTMTTNRMLDGKVIIVTGAGGGIGRDIALMAGAHGAKVVVNDVGAALDGHGEDKGPAERVVEEIRSAGEMAVASLDSVADSDGAERMVRIALREFGRLDGIVNNAGILRDAFFHKMTLEEWDSVLRVHLYGSFNVSRAAAAVFKEQQSGSVVHMTSTSGLIGNMAQANYSAAKMGIVGLSKSIALDMRRFGVRSNCIAPFAWSRMISSIKVDSPEQQARVARLQQMTPAKVAPLAVYLLSDRADSVSGQIFCVRNNEIFLFSQPRPVRSVQREQGWTPEQIAEHAMPALSASFYELDVSADVFSWDPV
jgi:NAD(P)-dependent dehydrogenase (short-subunit alcohol dehydrogenase family)